MSEVATQPLLSTHALQVMMGTRCLVQDLNLQVQAGETLAILGRNGSGKSTLLHTLAGVRPAAAGQLDLCGTPYAEQLRKDPRNVARLRGLLTQTQNDAFPATVLETALIGRHPHLGRWAFETQRDEEIACAALTAVGLQGFEQCAVHALSGGERQRLAIASLLTQQPLLYLLDEPLAHLDLHHQMSMLDLMQCYAAECRASFVVVLHDVNLALRYCQRALLLFGEGRWLEGPSAEILNSARLSELYAHPLRELQVDGQRILMPV